MWSIYLYVGVDCVQVIHVPAVSVWSICCKELNGDIVAGSRCVWESLS